jgi:hypothetical protein
VMSTGGDKRWTRDGAAVRVFPPAIPLIAILAGSGLQYVWPIDLGLEIPELVRYWIGGVIFAGAGLRLGFASARDPSGRGVPGAQVR